MLFISENVLLKEGHVNKAYKYLEDKKLLYEGNTNPPKGSKKDEWIEKKHILFKSKNFGDDEDRVVKKHDGQCVSSTVRSLADESFEVLVVEDCCAAATDEIHLQELKIINMIYCHVLQSEDVKKLLSF